MGCSKNLVDSERVLKLMEAGGISVRHNPEEVDADVVVINTCGFIGDAKQESIDMILSCCEAKKEGQVKAVYVMGCLSQRYLSVLPDEIPEVDGWYGKFDWDALCKGLVAKVKKNIPELRPWERKLTTPPYSAYIKVSEGCNRRCAYCAIPLITGPHRSRPFEEIVEEVKALAARGVKEFNVIAQDLSSYGLDLYGSQRLPELVDAIAGIEGVEWVRLHYLYPTQFPWGILDVMNRRPNVCRYLDIALQHCSDKVLCNMRRHIDRKTTEEVIDRIRRTVPDIHLRTTLMVGFPGEGEEEFEELLEFTEKQKFERMGAFAYCEEEDTYAAENFTDSIPEDVKEERLTRLMELQEGIALDSNLEKVGKTLRVLIERETPDYYVGRTEWDSPEVDPEVLVEKTRPLTPGEFVDVLVSEAMPFELIGRLTD